MTQPTSRRLEVLSAHLSPCPAPPGLSLHQQACAAHSTILFGRPAASRDVLFARPAAVSIPDSELEAAGRAVAVLSAASRNQGAAIVLAGNPAGPSCEDAGQEAQPRFGRPVAAAQDRTSLFAGAPVPLPFVPPAPSAASSSRGRGSAAGTAGEAQAAQEGAEAAKGASQAGPWRPQINVYETDYGWAVDVALPGVRPEDIRVELSSRTLTISGSRQASPSSAGGAGLLPDLVALLPAVFGLPSGPGRAVRQEMAAGAFSARWLLPEGADPESLQAVFRDGVLRLRVNKQGVFSLS